jgi:CheY-like chemotaxis protein
MDIEEILTSFGYSVAGTAASGEEAVRAAIELRPDLILMDIVLSGEMTGIEAAEVIRERAGIPVIYLTANADAPTVDSARKTEPFGYVLKPVSERELYSNIDAALQKHELMKRIKESEERYRMLVENAIEGILVVNEEKIVYAIPR